MLTNFFYLPWFRSIQDLRPGQRDTQFRAFFWLVTVPINRVASKA